MSPVTHFLTGWVIANSAALDRRDRALVTGVSVVPDIDGLGIIAEVLTRNSETNLDWFSSFHHSLHTPVFALILTGMSLLFAAQRVKVAPLVFLSLHLHLLEDLPGSRGRDGYPWPIPDLAPFSHKGDLTWSG